MKKKSVSAVSMVIDCFMTTADTVDANDVGYRYYATQDVKFDLTKADFASHNIMAGLRYHF